jgi:hypothetical protein
MNEKQAIEICEAYGWEVVKAKYTLGNGEDTISFFNTKQLIDYAKELKRTR